MSINNNEPDVMPIDPPDNQGGGGLDSGNTDAAPIDPPDNQGGGN